MEPWIRQEEYHKTRKTQMVMNALLQLPLCLLLNWLGVWGVSACACACVRARKRDESRTLEYS
jgi:hypothetical protein